MPLQTVVYKHAEDADMGIGEAESPVRMAMLCYRRLSL